MSMSVGEKVLTCMVMGNIQNLGISLQPSIMTENQEEQEEQEVQEPNPEEPPTIINKDSNICQACGQKKPIIKLPVARKSIYQVHMCRCMTKMTLRNWCVCLTILPM